MRSVLRLAAFTALSTHALTSPQLQLVSFEQESAKPSITIDPKTNTIDINTGVVRLDEFMKSFAKAAGEKEDKYVVNEKIKGEMIILNVKGKPLPNFKSQLADAVRAEFQTIDNKIHLLRTPAMEKKLQDEANARDRRDMAEGLKNHIGGDSGWESRKLSADDFKNSLRFLQQEASTMKDAKAVAERLELQTSGALIDGVFEILRETGVEPFIGQTGRVVFATRPNSLQKPFPEKARAVVGKLNKFIEEIRNWEHALHQDIQQIYPKWRNWSAAADCEWLLSYEPMQNARGNAPMHKFRLGLKRAGEYIVTPEITIDSAKPAVPPLSNRSIDLNAADASDVMHDIVKEFRRQPDNIMLQSPNFSPDQRLMLLKNPYQLPGWMLDKIMAALPERKNLIACIPDDMVFSTYRLLTKAGVDKISVDAALGQMLGGVGRSEWKLDESGTTLIMKPTHPLHATAQRVNLAAILKFHDDYTKNGLNIDNLSQLVKQNPLKIMDRPILGTLAVAGGWSQFPISHSYMEDGLRIYGLLSPKQQQDLKTEKPIGLSAPYPDEMQQAIRRALHEGRHHAEIPSETYVETLKGDVVKMDSTDAFAGGLPAALNINMPPIPRETRFQLCNGDAPINALRSFVDSEALVRRMVGTPNAFDLPLPPAPQGERWLPHSVHHQYVTFSFFYTTAPGVTGEVMKGLLVTEHKPLMKMPGMLKDFPAPMREELEEKIKKYRKELSDLKTGGGGGANSPAPG